MFWFPVSPDWVTSFPLCIIRRCAMLVENNITKQDLLLWIGKGDKDIMKKEIFKRLTWFVNTKFHLTSSVWSAGNLFSGAKRENMDQRQLFFKVKNIVDSCWSKLNVYLVSFIWLSTSTSTVIPARYKIKYSSPTHTAKRTEENRNKRHGKWRWSIRNDPSANLVQTVHVIIRRSNDDVSLSWEHDYCSL